ncbi:uncharacterized protein LOC107638523 [Arachis ipaensis]|nr:uncharacterized protein LOC107638523 [Arachis ipaensis]
MGVGTSPDLDVRVTWLTNYLPPKDAVKWEDEDMIISCGQFKTATGASCSIVCKNTHSFSHELHPVAIEGNGKNKKYTILPRKGEVWALYKKWSAKIRSSDLSNCEYDIVEVVDEDNSSGIKVLYLEKLSGFNSVFKGKTGGRSSATIPSKRFLMFSHQIPAFRLTEEHGDLASFLELDPAALPTHYFSSK